MVAGFTVLFPMAPSLYVLLGSALGFGFFNGLFHSCANVFILSLWEGRNSSPHVFALHFSFGVGSLLSPILAKPFLSSGNPLQTGTPGPEDVLDMTRATDNYTMEFMDQIHHTPQEYGVKCLYSIIGAQLVVLFLPLLVFYILERQAENRLRQTSAEQKTCEDDRLGLRPRLILLAFMFFVYFFSAGLEISFRSYISTFTVSLGHSRQDGSDITALYYTSFAAVRGMSVIGGIYLSPSAVMWTSLSLCLGGTTLLSAVSSQSFASLQVGVVLMGAGSACTFAGGLLWLKDVMKISNKVGSVLTVSMNISVQLYCLIIGSVIDDSPMQFMHLMSVSAIALVVMFALTSALAAYFRRQIAAPPLITKL
jgi:fucose permease